MDTSLFKSFTKTEKESDPIKAASCGKNSAMIVSKAFLQQTSLGTMRLWKHKSNFDGSSCGQVYGRGIKDQYDWLIQFHCSETKHQFDGVDVE